MNTRSTRVTLTTFALGMIVTLLLALFLSPGAWAAPRRSG